VRKVVVLVPISCCLFAFQLIAQAQQTSFPQKPSTEPSIDVNEAATKLVKSTRAFLEGHSATPGLKVELRESSRGQKERRLVVRYNAYVHGAPNGHTFSLLSWPINAASPSTVMDGVSLGPDGIVICAGRTPEQCGSPDRPDDPVDLVFFPAKGEPVRLVLTSDDKSMTVIFGAVPDPVSKTDRGCTINAIRLLPKWEVVLIRVEGLKPEEAVHLAGKSINESHGGEGKADPNGEYITALMPAVSGKESGMMDFRVSGSACSPEVSFQWGKL
jgi:hypothetical protein